MDRQTHIPDTHRQMDTYRITAPETFFMALLTLLCVIVREGLAADSNTVTSDHYSPYVRMHAHTHTHTHTYTRTYKHTC